MTTIRNKFMLLLCLLTLAVSAFAASEAEYKNLSRTYTLHTDGSQELRYNMELTLFTHTAMNGTYGESFIVYNPNFQELKIHASYTKQKDGNIIKTPANAFVEVLPRNAADAPAYNHLKEMVVVHTGLELGATIYLDYSVVSKPGYLPQIDICENLLQTSPVKEYTITIVTPQATLLRYSLQHSSVKPTDTTSDGMKRTSWTFRNLPASSRAPFVSAANGDVPCLAATTYATEGDALNALYKQFNPADDAQLETVAEALTEGKNSETEKLEAIHRYLITNYANCPLSLPEAGYRIRNADAVINTAYGTKAEKINLLAGLLNAVGIKAEPAALYHINASQGGCGLSAVDDLFVVASADGNQYLLSSMQNSVAQAGLMNNRVLSRSLKTGEVITIETPATAIDYKVELAISPEKADAKVSATIGNAYIPYYGDYLPRFAGADKEAKGTKGKENTTLTYSASQPLKAQNGYVMVSLPDAPVSLSHAAYCSLNSSRTENLSVPCQADEQYTYTIQIPDGMELCTPEAVKTIDNAAGTVTLSVKKNGSTAKVVRSLKLNKQLYTPAEYTNLRKLLTEWGNADNRIVLLSIK